MEEREILRRFVPQNDNDAYLADPCPMKMDADESPRASGWKLSSAQVDVNASGGRRNSRLKTEKQRVSSLSIRVRQAGGADRKHCRHESDAAWKSSTRKSAALSIRGRDRSPNICRGGPHVLYDRTRRWRGPERVHRRRRDSSLWRQWEERYGRNPRREIACRIAWARLRNYAF